MTTPKEFLSTYAMRSNMTPEKMLAMGLVVATCRCDEEGCEGFQIVSPENLLPWRHETILLSSETREGSPVDQRERITAIFAREIARAHEDIEPTPRIEWLEQLRDEVLASLEG